MTDIPAFVGGPDIAAVLPQLQNTAFESMKEKQMSNRSLTKHI